MSEIADLSRAIDPVFAPTATPEAVAGAVGAARELARRSYESREDGYEAYRSYQRTLFRLHYDPDPQTHWSRQYVASQVYDIEAHRMETPTGTGRPLSSVEFLARIEADQAELSPLKHELFQYLFEGHPSFDDVIAYLRQQWLIFQFFWVQFAELAAQLERLDAPIDHLAVLYENVWEEMGEGDPSTSHFVQHKRRQDELGIETSFRGAPDHPETMDYINTRLRLMRSMDPVAALGSVFSQEASAQSYGSQHHKMLVDAGIKEELGQVYAVHTTIDVEHAAEIALLGFELAETRADQERFFAGHRAQHRVWAAHMDRVIDEIRGRAPRHSSVTPLT